MLTVRQLSRQHLRRRARRAGLRSLRLVRRHHFSMLSGLVLAGALGIAVTSNVRDDSGQPAAPPTEAVSSDRPEIAANLVSYAVPSTPAQRLLVFYIVDSAAKQLSMETALQEDSSHRPDRGEPDVIPTFRYFLIVREAAEEAEAFEYLRDFAALTPGEGYEFRLVDTR